MANKIMAEYIWMDGKKPTAKLRSKTKLLEAPVRSLDNIPAWGFDGSSTEQAEGRFSDCLLKPVAYSSDPLRGEPNILVLCEVMNPDGTPHATNTRAKLRETAEKYQADEPWFGVEQEYTLYRKDWPLGWPQRGFPHPQGRYYCGVGCDEVYGRRLVEAHLRDCLKAGLSISGINAEVMPGQWEFQVGPLPPLAAADQLWLARWILYRHGEDFEVYAKLDPKPMPGDWNGAGGHTNFSTKQMRQDNQLEYIKKVCEKLGLFHLAHMQVYGADNDQRLTGKHETSNIFDFSFGVSDRGASIRIPMSTASSGRGYLEDRRPAANLDPYQVFTAILETVCGDGFKPKKFGWPDDVYRAAN